MTTGNRRVGGRGGNAWRPALTKLSREMQTRLRSPTTTPTRARKLVDRFGSQAERIISNAENGRSARVGAG